MKNRFIALVALMFAAALPAFAAGLAGHWTATFDSQIGQQKYTYDFVQAGDQLTGKATFDHQFGQGTVDLQSIKVEGDKVSFNEPFSMGGNEITITYQGTMAGDELKLTRHVGDLATEEIVAHREAVKP